MVAHPPLSNEPAAVREHAMSAAFNRSNANDYALYAAASNEIDRRWAADKAELDANLATFKRMLSEVTEECKHVLDERYAHLEPFQAHGLCYWNDNGCGYECIDKLYT